MKWLFAGLDNSAAGVKKRLDRACQNNWISKQQREVLKQLWNHRNNVHLRLLDTHEFNKYREDHYDEPRRALDAPMAKLEACHESR